MLLDSIPYSYRDIPCISKGEKERGRREGRGEGGGEREGRGRGGGEEGGGEGGRRGGRGEGGGGKRNISLTYRPTNLS